MAQFFYRHPRWASALKVVKTLRAAGHEALIAGGSVRDALLGRVPKDFDVATSARPEEIEAIFPRTEPVGKAFGVIMVVTEHGPLEVATFRRDGRYMDGRRPETVEFSSSQEDAKRRDFTINALFFDPIEERVIDHVGGIKDLEKHLIRTVGDPKTRFSEDKLRMVRALRFVSQLEFSIDKQTWEAIKTLSPEVHVISHERRGQEMEKLLMGRRPDLGVWGLWLSGLDKVLMPGWSQSMGDGHNRLRTSLILRAAAERGLSSAARWAILFELDGPDLKSAEQSLKRFCFSHAQIRSVVGMIEDVIHLNQGKDIISSVQVLGKPSGPEALTLAYLQAREWGDRKHLEQVWQHYCRLMDSSGKLPKPLINGQDLMRWGVPQGAEMGVLLKEAYREQLKHTLQSKEDVKTWLTQKLHGIES